MTHFTIALHRNLPIDIHPTKYYIGKQKIFKTSVSKEGGKMYLAVCKIKS